MSEIVNLKSLAVDSILKIVNGKEAEDGKESTKFKTGYRTVNYWSNIEHFTDIFNAVLFDGEEVIKPEELEDVDTEESSILEHRDYAESIQASRDSIKVRKKSTAFGVELVLLGMEHQEHIHYAMPMRVMGYDYGIYKKQYDSNAKGYKSSEGLEEDVAGATNCRIDYNAVSKKGDFDMCTLFDEIARENEARGEARGIVEAGFDFGLSENDIVERLQKKLNLSLETAREYINMFGK